MNKYLRMLTFIAILGAVSGGLLFGAKAATGALITANADALLKSEILTAHEVSFTFANIHEVFDENTEITTVESFYGDADYAYTFYVDKNNGYITFGFGPIFGGGVWGPIIGLLSLEDDFTTIKRIAILQQEETPGLGGIVATRTYLDQFVGKTIGLGEDVLDIVKDLDVISAGDNEVRAITGATRTSNAFEDILNNAYAAYATIWQSL